MDPHLTTPTSHRRTVLALSAATLFALCSCDPPDENVDVDDLYLITVDDAGTLSVLSTVDRAWPEMLSTYVSPGTGAFVDVDGPWIYLGAWSGGLRILDGTDPGDLVETAVFQASGAYESGSVEVRNGLAYVAEYQNGMVIVDVSTPATPVAVSRTTAFAALVALHGDHALVAGPNPVRIYDVSDPTAPEKVADLPVGDQVNDMLVDGELLYLAVDDGLQIADLTDPAEPVLLGSVDTADRGLGLALHGDRIYLAAGEAGVRGIDVSDPAAPVETWTDGWSDHANDVAIHDGWLWIADDSGGPDPYELSDPDSPAKVVLELYMANPMKTVIPWPRSDG